MSSSLSSSPPHYPLYKKGVFCIVPSAALSQPFHTFLHLSSNRSPCPPPLFLPTQVHALHCSKSCISKMQSDQFFLAFTLRFYLSCLAQLAQPLFFFPSLISYSSSIVSPQLGQSQIAISTTIYSCLLCNVLPIYLSPLNDYSECKGLIEHVLDDSPPWMRHWVQGTVRDQ